MKPTKNARAIKVLQDDDYLAAAQGPSGCHADTDGALVALRRLEAKGLVHEGPFKNLSGRPVFFAEERGTRVAEDAPILDFQPMPRPPR